MGRIQGVCLALMLALLAVYEAWIFTHWDPHRIKSLRKQLNIILSLLSIVASRYIWRRFSIFIDTSSWALEVLLKFVLLVFLLLGQGTFIFVSMFPGTDPLWLSYVVSFTVGSGFLLTFSMVVMDISSFLFRRILCRNYEVSGSGRTEIKIRTLLSLISALILVVVGTVNINSLDVERVVVPIKGLHSHFNGTTIVQVSDIHLGPFNGKSTLSSVVAEVNRVNGDIVVITGDLVDSSVAALKEAVMPLKQLKTKYGAYYITGNHEYYTGDVDNWLMEIPKLNVTPLVNQRVCVPASSEINCKRGFYLAGLEDLATRTLRYGSHSMNVHSALSGRSAGVPTVVLAHQPWAAQEAILWDDVRLVLSGHTHAGQILPFMFLTYLYNPFFVGLYQPYPQVYVYVNPGTVYYLLPFRHYRPEITHITLISG